MQLTQRQLVESEKMAVLGNLVVGVSHEIDTPLGISIMEFSLLKEKSIALFADKNQNKLTKTVFNDFEDTVTKCIAIISSNLDRTS